MGWYRGGVSTSTLLRRLDRRWIALDVGLVIAIALLAGAPSPREGAARRPVPAAPATGAPLDVIGPTATGVRVAVRRPVVVRKEGLAETRWLAPGIHALAVDGALLWDEGGRTGRIEVGRDGLKARAARALLDGPSPAELFRGATLLDEGLLPYLGGSTPADPLAGMAWSELIGTVGEPGERRELFQRLLDWELYAARTGGRGAGSCPPAAPAGPWATARVPLAPELDGETPADLRPAPDASREPGGLLDLPGRPAGVFELEWPAIDAAADRHLVVELPAGTRRLWVALEAVDAGGLRVVLPPTSCRDPSPRDWLVVALGAEGLPEAGARFLLTLGPDSAGRIGRGVPRAWVGGLLEGS